MRIGLIQTCALGDIIIALPIAQYFIKQGHQVVWPIDEIFFPAVKAAAPEVDFMPVPRGHTGIKTLEYYLTFPKKIIQHFGCEKHFVLYSTLRPYDLGYPRLSHSLKFDEYKYAVAGVPFIKKWDLQVHRNSDGEQKLLELLNLSLNEKYVVLQDMGGDDIKNSAAVVPGELKDKYRIVSVENLTGSLFDWIPVFENAAELHLIDSAPANLVEQLRLSVKKTLYLRSPASHTPVFAHGWHIK